MFTDVGRLTGHMACYLVLVVVVVLAFSVVVKEVFVDLLFSFNNWVIWFLVEIAWIVQLTKVLGFNCV